MRHCKFAWDQFQRSISLATDTMTHTVEVAEIANLGLVFLLFMIGWETQFFASKLDQWFAHLPRNRFRGFKAWSWMFTRSFALLGTKSMASLHSKHFPSLSSTCCVADVEKKISNFSFGWDGTSGFAYGTLPISCVLWSRGLSVCLSQTCIILHMLYRCNKNVKTKWTNENMGQIKDLQGQRRIKPFSFSCLCDPSAWAQRDSSRELSRNPTKVDQSPSWCQAQYLIFTGLNAIGLSMGSGDSAVMRPKSCKSS